MSISFKQINKKESVLLEFLKIFLLAEVIIGHAIALSMPKYDEFNINSFFDFILILIKLIFSFGRESAYLFIFLSGFFTSNTLFGSTSKVNFFDILKRRIYRIYPILVLALLLTVLLDWTGMSLLKFESYKNNVLSYSVVEHFSIKILFLNFLSLQPTFTPAFGSNGPLWTLGYLMQFYLIFAFLRRFCNSRKTLSILTLLLSITLFITGIVEFALLFLIWYLGMLVRQIKIRYISSNKYITLILGAIIIAVANISPSQISIIITPIYGIIILSTIKQLPSKIWGLDLLIIKKPIDLSYALYAVHMPILFFIYALLSNVLVEVPFKDISALFIVLSVSMSVIVSNLIIKLIQWRLKAK